LIVCEYLVGSGGGTRPTIILDGTVPFIGEDLVVGQVEFITRIGSKDLIIELVDDSESPIEWIRLVGLPINVTELIERGEVVNVIDGSRVIGVVQPLQGVEQANGVVLYGT
jgi:hypothetical protein